MSGSSGGLEDPSISTTLYLLLDQLIRQKIYRLVHEFIKTEPSIEFKENNSFKDLRARKLSSLRKVLPTHSSRSTYYLSWTKLGHNDNQFNYVQN